MNWWQVQVHHYNAQLVSIIYRYLWCDNMTICDMCFQIISPNLDSGWWIVLAEIWQRYRIIFQITRLLSTSAAIRSGQLVDNYFLRDKTNKQTNKILETFQWTTGPSMTVVPQLESLSSLRLDKISKIDVSRNRLQTIESALAGWLAGEHRRVLDLSHNQVAALYCTVLYCTVLYCTVLCWTGTAERGQSMLPTPSPRQRRTTLRTTSCQTFRI